MPFGLSSPLRLNDDLTFLYSVENMESSENREFKHLGCLHTNKIYIHDMTLLPNYDFGFN